MKALATAGPSAVSSSSCLRNPVMRLIRVAIAIDPVAASKPFCCFFAVGSDACSGAFSTAGRGWAGRGDGLGRGRARRHRLRAGAALGLRASHARRHRARSAGGIGRGPPGGIGRGPPGGMGRGLRVDQVAALRGARDAVRRHRARRHPAWARAAGPGRSAAAGPGVGRAAQGNGDRGRDRGSTVRPRRRPSALVARVLGHGRSYPSSALSGWPRNRCQSRRRPGTAEVHQRTP